MLILEYSWPLFMLILGLPGNSGLPMSNSRIFLASAPHVHSVHLMLIQCSPCSFWASLAHSGGFLDILGNSGLLMLILGLLGSFWIFLAIQCSPCSFWTSIAHSWVFLAIQGSPCSLSASLAHSGPSWLILAHIFSHSRSFRTLPCSFWALWLSLEYSRPL